MEESIAQKRCSKCGGIKYLSDFHKRKDGNLCSWCKSCIRQDNNSRRDANKERYNEIARKFYKAHRAEHVKHSTSYNKNHPEQRQATCKRYRENHKEEARKYRQEYRASHLATIQEKRRKYLALHPEVITTQYQRRRARKLNASGDGVTKEQWKMVLEEFGYRCAYCSQQKPLAMDHIVPLSKGGRYDLDNIVPACQPCNSSKGTHSLIMFLYRRLL